MELNVLGKSSGTLRNFLMCLMERNNYAAKCPLPFSVTKRHTDKLTIPVDAADAADMPGMVS